MSAMYVDYAIDLAVDVVAIFLLAYTLYFRRHRRADLLLAYVTLNIGLFVAMSVLTSVRVDVALGFGLFAILSIIRLRSSAVTQQEVAYYFAALVIGLGQAGLRVLQRLRHDLTERYGPPSNTPLVRTLFVDTDPDALADAAESSIDLDRLVALARPPVLPSEEAGEPMPARNCWKPVVPGSALS